MQVPKGTQLGRVERRLLLDAPAFGLLGPPLDDVAWCPVWAYGAGPAGKNAAKRATAKLEGLGWLEVLRLPNGRPALRRYQRHQLPALIVAWRRAGWMEGGDPRLGFMLRRRDEVTGKVEWKSHVVLRSMRRTTLGDQVVEQYRPQLESALAPGKMLPIRWR